MTNIYNNIYTIIQILFFLIIFVLLVYTTINVKFIVNNLSTNCSKQEFDPTKKYSTSFENKSVSITGTKTNNTSGVFSVTIILNEGNTNVFQGQKYEYNKLTCELKYTLTNELIQYLTTYKIDLFPYTANLLANNGLRLNGNYKGLKFSITLNV